MRREQPAGGQPAGEQPSGEQPAGEQTWRDRPVRGGYGAVVLLVVLTYVLALSADQRWMIAVLLFVQTFTVWHALRVSRARPGTRLVAALVFLLALVAAVAIVFVRNSPLDSPLTAWTFLAASTLYLVAPFSILRHLGSRREVDRQTLLGALSAYLLIGMAFGFAYSCVAGLQPGPLFGANGDPSLSDALFFSFVTMTTTGYGDLVPVDNPARSIAVLEALLGQLFLVTAVAKVVENWRPRNWQTTTEEQP